MSVQGVLGSVAEVNPIEGLMATGRERHQPPAHRHAMGAHVVGEAQPDRLRRLPQELGGARARHQLRILVARVSRGLQYAEAAPGTARDVRGVNASIHVDKAAPRAALADGEAGAGVPTPGPGGEGVLGEALLGALAFGHGPWMDDRLAPHLVALALANVAVLRGHVHGDDACGQRRRGGGHLGPLEARVARHQRAHPIHEPGLAAGRCVDRNDDRCVTYAADMVTAIEIQPRHDGPRCGLVHGDACKAAVALCVFQAKVQGPPPAPPQRPSICSWSPHRHSRPLALDGVRPCHGGAGGHRLEVRSWQVSGAPAAEGDDRAVGVKGPHESAGRGGLEARVAGCCPVDGGGHP
mmetsp:Transcript_47382/g.141408  ORF Transcript_47382/g.141408 Transcript_47382/m.141408 type:complete len:352 (-) Transcript_47382:176-1231(-)